jgi:ketosteroid isomerase-like protein
MKTLSEFGQNLSAQTVIAENAELVGPVSDIENLLAWLDSWHTAYLARNVEAILDRYEHDAILMTHGYPDKRGHAALRTYFERRLASGIEVDSQFEVTNIVVEDDRASVIANWTVQGADPEGQSLCKNGRSLALYKRGTDGLWRMWRDIDNRPR